MFVEARFKPFDKLQSNLLKHVNNVTGRKNLDNFIQQLLIIKAMAITSCARKLKTHWLNKTQNIDNNCYEGNFI